MKERNALALRSEADYLAPYLVYFEEMPPTADQSIAIFHDCLNAVKTDFVEMLNELQRKYDEVILSLLYSNNRSLLIVSLCAQLDSEALQFKRFLNRFQDQFGDFDYERLVKEG